MTAPNADHRAEAIRRARQIIASEYVQPYQVNAILRGDWDPGKFIQDEADRQEVAVLRELKAEDECED